MRLSCPERTSEYERGIEGDSCPCFSSATCSLTSFRPQFGPNASHHMCTSRRRRPRDTGSQNVPRKRPAVHASVAQEVDTSDPRAFAEAFSPYGAISNAAASKLPPRANAVLLIAVAFSKLTSSEGCRLLSAAFRGQTLEGRMLRLEEPQKIEAACPIASAM